MISNKKLDELIREHERYGIMAHRNNDKDALRLINSVVDALQELKEHKECELRPATKFRNKSLEGQLCKIKEEFDETRSAFYRSDVVNLVEELGDLQAACVTMLDMMSVDEKARMNLRKSINKKNRARGYFDELVADQNKHRKLDELSKAAAPLIELMQRKYNPHHKIIVTLDGAEVMSGEVGVPAEVRDIE